MWKSGVSEAQRSSWSQKTRNWGIYQSSAVSDEEPGDSGNVIRYVTRWGPSVIVLCGALTRMEPTGWVRGGLLDQLLGCGLGGPPMALTHWRGWESVVTQSVRLDVPVWPWRTGGFLESRWSLVYQNPKEINFNMGEGMPRQQNWCACQQDWRQACRHYSLPSSPYLGCHQKVPPTFRVCLPSLQIIWIRKFLTGVPSGFCFDSTCNYVDSQD